MSIVPGGLLALSCHVVDEEIDLLRRVAESWKSTCTNIAVDSQPNSAELKAVVERTRSDARC